MKPHIIKTVCKRLKTTFVLIHHRYKLIYIYYIQLIYKKIGNRNTNTKLSVPAPVLQENLRNCNHFHNILRLFDILPDFPFTTSETKYY